MGTTNQANDLPDGWGLLRRINDETDADQPWKLIIAEDMKNNDWVTRPTADGGAGFDSQWDPSFVSDVRAQLRPAQDTGRSMAAIAGALTHRYNDRPLARVVFTESHDEDGNNGGRLPHDIDPQHPDSFWAKKRSTLGAAIMFTAPGIPMMFQGQEILEDRWFTLDRTPPVDWAKETRFKGIWMLYQDLIRLRRNRTSTDRWAARRRCPGSSRQRHRQGDRLPPVGWRRPTRRCARRRQLRRSPLRHLQRWRATRRCMAGPVLQRRRPV